MIFLHIKISPVWRKPRKLLISKAIKVLHMWNFKLISNWLQLFWWCIAFQALKCMIGSKCLEQKRFKGQGQNVFVDLFLYQCNGNLNTTGYFRWSLRRHPAPNTLPAAPKCLCLAQAFTETQFYEGTTSFIKCKKSIVRQY